MDQQQTPIIRFLDRRTPPHIATLVLMAGISSMTMTIFLPSLPEMTEYFSTDYKYMQLSVGVFMAMNAALQLIVGPLSDRFGRRPIALVGVALFIIASFSIIQTTTIETFLILRAAQASIVSSMVLSRAVIRDVYPGNMAVTMAAYVTMGVALVPMITPTIGGFLSMAYGWESSFWLLFGAGIMLWLLVYFDLGETAPKSTGSFTQMIAGFPELLSSRRFLGYAFCAAFASGSFFAFLGGAPFVGGTLYNMSEAQLGMGMGAPAIGYFFGNFITARLSSRIGMNMMCFWGAVITLVGIFFCAVLAYTDHLNAFWFFALLIPLGFGNGMVMPNALTGSISVRRNLAGTAAGLGGAMMIGGGAMLSALAGSVLSQERGALPLLLIMLFAASMSLLSAIWVIQRERSLRGDT